MLCGNCIDGRSWYLKLDEWLELGHHLSFCPRRRLDWPTRIVSLPRHPSQLFLGKRCPSMWQCMFLSLLLFVLDGGNRRCWSVSKSTPCPPRERHTTLVRTSSLNKVPAAVSWLFNSQIPLPVPPDRHVSCLPGSLPLSLPLTFQLGHCEGIL